MIRVQYDARKLRLSVSGHAGSAPKGQDLVCAAATTLVYTAAQMLRDAEEDGLAEDVRFCADDGKADLVAKAKPGAGKELAGRMEAVCIGFRMLEKNYPKFIRVEGRKATP